MNEQEWDRLRTCEEKLWWYKALHQFLLRFIPAENITKDSYVLDVGCGTGGFMDKLRSKAYRIVGFDISMSGIRHVKERGFSSAYVASANNFPFKNESFNLITCIDVLECESVSPDMLINEAFRVLKPGGCALFQMAAYQWLLSEHDRAVHSTRRFNRRQMKALFKGTDFQIIYTTHLFFFLFPILALWKLMHQLRKNIPREAAISDVKLPGPCINRLLYAICLLESIFVPRFILPVGTSVCALVKKND